MEKNWVNNCGMEIRNGAVLRRNKEKNDEGEDSDKMTTIEANKQGCDNQNYDSRGSGQE